MPIVFAVIALASVLAASAGGGCKKSQPVIIPDALFSIDANDPRDAAVHQYLQKKIEDLRGDHDKYPGFKVQIEALMNDASNLDHIPVADPSYAEKFTEFHASLVSLWALENNDSI